MQAPSQQPALPARTADARTRLYRLRRQSEPFSCRLPRRAGRLPHLR
jgi:hypothetical protein